MEKNVCVLPDDCVSSQRTVGFVPLIDPVDHSDQRKGRGTRRDWRRRITRALNVGDEMLDEVQVILLASVDFAPERRRQRMILVQHDRNLTVFGTDHNLDVQPDIAFAHKNGFMAKTKERLTLDALITLVSKAVTCY